MPPDRNRFGQPAAGALTCAEWELITRCAERCGTTVELPKAPDKPARTAKASRDKRARSRRSSEPATTGRAVRDPKGRLSAARVRKVQAQASEAAAEEAEASIAANPEPFVPIGASAAPPREAVRRKRLIYRYQKALAWRPDDAGLHKQLARALEADGQRDQAAHHFSEYLRLSPTAPDASDIRQKVFRLRVPVE